MHGHHEPQSDGKGGPSRGGGCTPVHDRSIHCPVRRYRTRRPTDQENEQDSKSPPRDISSGGDDIVKGPSLQGVTEVGRGN